MLIGGVAVGAHGVVRATKDVDICPSPARSNLQRLTALLAKLGVTQVGVEPEGFEAQDMPFDPTNPEDLAAGGNFRLETLYGVLDLMQWIPGIDGDHAYPALARNALVANALGIQVHVASLEDLRTMKRAAGRPQDLQDLADLESAHPEG